MKIPEQQIKLKNGKTVVIKSVKAADAELMLQHLQISHRESYKNMNQSAEFWLNFHVEDEKRILGEFESARNKFMLSVWFEGKIVGGLGLVGHGAEFVKHNASLGMSIQNAFCNSGLGTELMKTAIKLAKEIGWHRIDLTVRTYNTGGIKLYEKSGFERIGLLKDAAFIDGKYVDEYSYQLILK
jgi:RimJ/RimL family protein N-acetyltransferase